MPRLAEQRKEALASMMREGIYEAAITILERLGPDGLTMERVAEQASVSKGSLYNYFPNKNELLKFVHNRTVEPLQQHTKELMEQELGAEQKLRAILCSWFTHVNQRRSLFNFLFNEHSLQKLIKPEENHAHRKAIGHLKMVVQQGIDEGGFRQQDTDFAAMILMGGAKEICEQLVPDEASWDVEHLVDTIMNFYLGGLTGRDA